MAIKKEYQNYLSHFKKTVTANEFAHSNSKNQICLRHDVDHDIDVALEMAFWEFQKGFRATYFVLPGTKYWTEDSRFLEKCLQIQDFGHEIGLHVNTIADWFLGHIDDPVAAINQDLKRLRSAGLNVTGVAAHGDKACYEADFINYWLFKELKSDDPNLSEQNLTAEGIPAQNKKRSISYNFENDKIIRSDGATLNLWSCSMADLGLLYHATHLNYGSYYTDSGGRWTVTTDPLEIQLSTGRHQINMHPIHWKDEKKVYFFLSTARSGSKWLASVCDAATSIETRHEHILNFKFKDGEYIEKHSTGLGYTELAADQNFINSSLKDARDWISQISKGDFGEINVYLERHIKPLKAMFPNATFIYLSRKPEDIITSIMNRNWFDTDSDTRHPPVEGIDNWEYLSPFERCCLYVKGVSSRLSSSCNIQLQHEKITNSPDELAKSLRAIDIAFYPRLADGLFESRINENKHNNYPAHKDWSEKDKSRFSLIFGFNQGLQSKFNCLANSPFIYKLLSLLPDWIKYFKILIINIENFIQLSVSSENVNFKNNSICIDQLNIRHEAIHLKHKRKMRYDRSELELCINMTLEAEEQGIAQVFLLGFDNENNKVERRLLVKIQDGVLKKRLKFRPGFSTTHFNFQIQIPNERGPSNLLITQFDIFEKTSLNHALKFAREYLSKLLHEKGRTVKRFILKSLSKLKS